MTREMLSGFSDLTDECFFLFCREFKIRLRRDLQIFTDNFRAENSEFDPAKVVEGDVEGRVWWLSYFEHNLIIYVTG